MKDRLHAESILLGCLYVILTRNYASNHWLRAAVLATQCCDAVCECSLEIWILETPNRWTMYLGDVATVLLDSVCLSFFVSFQTDGMMIRSDLFFLHILLFFCTSYCFVAQLIVFLHILLFCCTTYCFFAHLNVLLHILLFCCTSYCFVAHLIVFCTSYCFALFISLHILLLFLFFTIYMLLCCVTLYNFFFFFFALSTERTWFDYISLLIIPCIIYYVTNKETLTLTRSLCVEHWLLSDSFCKQISHWIITINGKNKCLEM